MDCKTPELKVVYSNAAEIDYDRIPETELCKLADAFLRAYMNICKNDEGSNQRKGAISHENI